MKCATFETRLAAYLSGSLKAAEARDVAEHAASCPDCRELVELARLEVPGDRAGTVAADLVGPVLERTSGAACRSAEPLLCDRVDQTLDAARSDLLDRHLAECPECSGLARALESLRRDLPTLAIVAPDDAFLDDVLARTLPWRTQLVRWWRGTWPRWVARPRFAAEAAYALTLILCLLVSVPGTPLQAMPEHATEIAKSVPGGTVRTGWQAVEERVRGGYQAVLDAPAASGLVDSWGRTLELGTAAAERSRELLSEAPGFAREKLRTFRDWIASLLETDADPESTADAANQEEAT